MIAREVCLLPEDCASLAVAWVQQRGPATEGSCETKRACIAEQVIMLKRVKGSHGE
jgi:hypothetical protein